MYSATGYSGHNQMKNGPMNYAGPSRDTHRKTRSKMAETSTLYWTYHPRRIDSTSHTGTQRTAMSLARFPGQRTVDHSPRSLEYNRSLYPDIFFKPSEYQKRLRASRRRAAPSLVASQCLQRPELSILVGPTPPPIY